MSTKKPTTEQMMNAVFWMLEADIVDCADGDVRAVAQWLLEQVRTDLARATVTAYDRQVRSEGKRVANRTEAVTAVAKTITLTFGGNGLMDDMARCSGLQLQAVTA